MIKRRPSELGEWETGCHGHHANNMALTASSWSQFSDNIRTLLPKWSRAVQSIRAQSLATAPEEVERISLGWLLANCREMYEEVAWSAVSAIGLDEQDPDELYTELTETDSETIRDWFCWLHRELVSLAKDEQLAV